MLGAGTHAEWSLSKLNMPCCRNQHPCSKSVPTLELNISEHSNTQLHVDIWSLTLLWLWLPMERTHFDNIPNAFIVFLIAVENAPQRQFQQARIYFALLQPCPLWQGSRKVGRGDIWSHCVWSQEAESSMLALSSLSFSLSSWDSVAPLRKVSSS